jgi:hypothetical protein
VHQDLPSSAPPASRTSRALGTVSNVRNQPDRVGSDTWTKVTTTKLRFVRN